jgi:hypothetical protein
MGEPKFPSPEKRGRDVTSEFMQGAREFMEFYDSESLRSEPYLEINMDLAGITDPHEFAESARRAKAFLDEQPRGQRRDASIRCAPGQKRWEYNVFASGVRWENAE